MEDSDKECDERRFRLIAQKCNEFEHVVAAMAYGFSFLNFSPDESIRQCSDCVNWLGGSCEIFRQAKEHIDFLD